MTNNLSHIWKCFEPVHDITAYELSIICMNLFGTWGSWKKIGFTADQWESLDPAIARHFKNAEDEKL